MRIEWDPTKSIANEAKHGVRFEAAAELLAGETEYLEIFDEDHSENEDRFIAIGPVHGAVLVVVFTEPADDLLGIISARVATKTERGMYEDYEAAR